VNFTNIINTFEPISLSEMDNVKLLDRTDKKFMINTNQLSDFLKAIQAHYKLLEISGKRINDYRSYYFDTPDLELYKMHHNGHLNRLKIRFRSYIASGIHFLEIKTKSNKGRTVKHRINTENPGEIKETESNFIAQFYKGNIAQLQNSLTIDYQRITLVNKDVPERVTIDLNLAFINLQQRKILPGIAVIEIKQDKLPYKTKAEIALKKMRAKEGFMSKYCLGIALLKEAKQNLFKQKIRKILKTNAYE
jgi:hypothetical protein